MDYKNEYLKMKEKIKNLKKENDEFKNYFPDQYNKVKEAIEMEMHGLKKYKKTVKSNLKNNEILNDNKIENIDFIVENKQKNKNQIINNNTDKIEKKTAFQNTILSKKLRCNIKDPNIILTNMIYRDNISNDVLEMVREKKGLSLHIFFKCIYYEIEKHDTKNKLQRVNIAGKTQTRNFVFSDKRINILNDDVNDINEKILNNFKTVVNEQINLEKYISVKKYNESKDENKNFDNNAYDKNYEFGAIISIEWLIYEYNPIKGRSYIELPDEINHKKACINIKNKDNKCFLWSVIAHLYPTTNPNPNRVSNYIEYEKNLILNDIDLSNGFQIKDIAKFEKYNNLSINVFAYETNNNKKEFKFNYDNFFKLLLIKQDSILKNLTCKENINISVINKLIDSNLLKNEIDWNEKQQLENIKSNIKNNKLKVKYIMCKYNFGRVYPLKSESLCSIRRELRHTLNYYNNEVNYLDIDIVNCHPVILNEICKNNNLNLFYLNDYVENRENKIMEFINVFKINRDLIKQLFLIIMYNGSINNFLKKNNIFINDNNNELIYLKNFQNDIKTIGNILLNNNKNVISDIKTYQKNKKYENDLGLILSVYIQDRERQILEIIYNYCNKNGFIKNNDCVLCFDGIMLNEKNIFNKDELIKNLENEIYTYTKMKISLKNKEMNEYYNLENINYDVIEKKEIKEKTKKHVEDKTIFFYPLYVSDFKSSKNIDLLYVENEEGNTHYVYIKNLSALLNKGGEKKGFYCRRCLSHFTSEENLNKHGKNCIHFDYQTCLMPFENEKIKFKNYKHLNIDHFNIMCDFEAICKKTNEKKGDNTTIYQEHEPISYSMVVNCISDINKNKYYVGYGVDCMDQFFNHLLEAKRYIENEFKIKKEIKLTPENLIYIKNCKNCEICGIEFNNTVWKNKDHDHYTGEFRFVLCSTCNFKIQKTKNINIFFHNGKKYDNHFIFKNINKLFTSHKNYDITVIGQTLETYMSFTIKEKNDEFGYALKFMDSNNLLMNSLASLSTKLKEDKKKTLYSFLKNKYNMSNDLIKFVSDKGVFCYDYIDDINKLEEQQLPKHKKWYSRLKQSNISKEEYNNAIKIFKDLKFKNIKEYLLFYNEIDTLLLTDILNNFRDEIYKNFKIDAAYYMSCPSLSWDLMLKSSKNEISLLSNIDMYIDFEKGIRGGMSSVLGDREVIANNKYLSNYDKTKPSTYILYIDANALYTYVMNSEKLPYDNFKYEENIEIFTSDYIKNYDFEGDKSFYFVVDLEYPRELFDDHINYPLAPTKMNISNNLLSDYQKDLIKNFNGIESNDKVEKLVLSFLPKNEYFVDGKTLQFYLNHDLTLKKVHRVISYNQKFLLKDYTNFWTDVRTEAKKNEDKNLDSMAKLFTNSIFGKNMQNTRKYKDVKILTSDEKNKFLKYSSRNLIKNVCLFNEDAIAIEKKKSKVYLNQPIFIGQAILDRSKVHMYKTYYDILKPKYGKGVEILYSDTDSMFLKITTDDLYDDMKKMNIFDFSEMKNKKFYDEETKQNIQPENHYKLGAFKCESKGLPIKKAIFLRSKMYLYEVEENDKIKHEKKSKGMSKNVVSNYKYEDYHNSLYNNNIKTDYMSTIQSNNHVINALNLNKISLSPFDDKRYYLTDGVRSVPFGYYDVNNNINENKNNKTKNKKNNENYDILNILF